MLKQYYKEKAKEFCQLRLGSMTMKEICGKFLSLFCYLHYIIDEKTKIQCFLRCLPIMFKEWIMYDNPKALEKAMKKENLCYDQNKNKRENVPNWKTKRCDNFDQGMMNTKFYKNIGNKYKGYEGNNYKGFKPQNPVATEREPPTTLIKTLHRGNH